MNDDKARIATLEADCQKLSDQWDADHADLTAQLAQARAERDAAQRLLDTPELHDFSKAVPLEAAHQRKRWGNDHDDGKAPQDWFWLVGYLAGKALRSHIDGDTDKALHHTVTVAAACANWHAAILGKTNMRPGIESPDAAIDAARSQEAGKEKP